MFVCFSLSNFNPLLVACNFIFVDLKSFVTTVLRTAYLTNYLGKYAIQNYISYAVTANKVNK